MRVLLVLSQDRDRFFQVLYDLVKSHLLILILVGDAAQTVEQAVSENAVIERIFLV